MLCAQLDWLNRMCVLRAMLIGIFCTFWPVTTKDPQQSMP